jgi:hypothetical protein
LKENLLACGKNEILSTVDALQNAIGKFHHPASPQQGI